MAHEVALDEVIEMRFMARFGAQAGIMIRHYQVKTLVGTTTNVQDVADAVDAAVALLIRALMSVATEYVATGAKRIIGAITDEFLTVVNAGVGDVAGDPCPPQVAGLISLRTGFAGRTNRGRAFMYFVPESACTAGKPTAGYVTDLQALGDALVAPVTATGSGPGDSAGLFPVVLHRGTLTVTDLDNAVARTSFATQRRRGFLAPSNVVP